jgi:hypothetical protein
LPKEVRAVVAENATYERNTLLEELSGAGKKI